MACHPKLARNRDERKLAEAPRSRTEPPRVSGEQPILKTGRATGPRSLPPQIVNCRMQSPVDRRLYQIDISRQKNGEMWEKRLGVGSPKQPCPPTTLSSAAGRVDGVR